MRSAKDLLVLIIGQTPRPDLLAPLQNTLATVSRNPRSTRVIGALDGLSQGALEAVTTKGTTTHGIATSCPLITKLADGSTVTILEDKVAQLMADKLEEGSPLVMASFFFSVPFLNLF